MQLVLDTAKGASSSADRTFGILSSYHIIHIFECSYSSVVQYISVHSVNWLVPSDGARTSGHFVGKR